MSRTPSCSAMVRSTSRPGRPGSRPALHSNNLADSNRVSRRLRGDDENPSAFTPPARHTPRKAGAGVYHLNARRTLRNEEPIRFGLALHIGQAMYGNIGGGNRLDFTCVGPAVNLAARLEKVAAKLGRTIVASAEFSAQLPNAFKPLGEYSVAGFVAPQAGFGLSDEAKRS